MSSLICSNRGMSLIEVTISLFLLCIGIMGLISLQPSGWRLSGKSDFLGRAAGLLHKELETSELMILNPSNPNPCAAVNPLTTTRTVYSSGQSSACPGDLPFRIQTTTRDLGDGSWRITVTVFPPGNGLGITDSLIATRQQFFAQ